MPLDSFEGFIVTLLLLAPGGLGIELRRWVYPSRAPSPFAELLHALGASGVALVALESPVAWLVGLTAPWPGGAGDALLVPLTEGRGIPQDATAWLFYLFAYVPLALSLPVLGGWLRRTHLVRRAFGRRALYDSAPDQLFEEIWGAEADGEAPWVVVETTDDRAIQGQVVWRATAPHDTEILLLDVYDVTDPRRPVPGGGGIIWIPRDSIRRLWLLSLRSEAAAAAS